MIAEDSVVVIPAYVGIILPLRFSLPVVITPSFDVNPSLKANKVPDTVGEVVPTPILIENAVPEVPTISVIT